MDRSYTLKLFLCPTKRPITDMFVPLWRVIILTWVWKSTLQSNGFAKTHLEKFEKPNPSSKIPCSCWYSKDTITRNIGFPDGSTHRLQKSFIDTNFNQLQVQISHFDDKVANAQLQIWASLILIFNDFYLKLNNNDTLCQDYKSIEGSSSCNIP